MSQIKNVINVFALQKRLVDDFQERTDIADVWDFEILPLVISNPIKPKR